MEKEFVTYEIALALKELGFDKKCFKGWYNQKDIESTVSNPVDFNNKNDSENFVSQPTFSQAFRWFREKYKMDSVIIRSFIMTNSYHYNIIIDQYYGNDLQSVYIPNRTYEEAELECLVKLIEIVKNK